MGVKPSYMQRSILVNVVTLAVMVCVDVSYLNSSPGDLIRMENPCISNCAGSTVSGFCQELGNRSTQSVVPSCALQLDNSSWFYKYQDILYQLTTVRWNTRISAPIDYAGQKPIVSATSQYHHTDDFDVGKSKQPHCEIITVALHSSTFFLVNLRQCDTRIHMRDGIFRWNPQLELTAPCCLSLHNLSGKTDYQPLGS